MNFLVDAHLPRRLVYRLREAGHDAMHTLDLPNKNRTTDTQINAISQQEQRIVSTKDADFVASFLLERNPYQLLFQLEMPPILRWKHSFCLRFR